MKNLQDKAVITLQPYATKLFRRIQEQFPRSTLIQNHFINSVFEKWLIDRNFVSVKALKNDINLEHRLGFSNGLSRVLKKEKWTTERSSS